MLFRILLAAIMSILASLPAPGSDTGGSDEDRWQLINQPVALPNVPQFSGGATFVSGVSFPAARGGSTIGLRYASYQDGASILHWYKGALEMYHWKVNVKSGEHNMITATQNGDTCTVRLLPPSRPESRQDFMVSYRWGRH